MLKMGLVLISMCLLSACSQNSSGGGSGGLKAPAGKMTPEILADTTTVLQQSEKFDHMMALTVSGENSFSSQAPSEISNNCSIESSRLSLIAEGISGVTYKIKGDDCPVDMSTLHITNMPKGMINDAWENFAVLKSQEYFKLYGFLKYTEKVTIDTKGLQKNRTIVREFFGPNGRTHVITAKQVQYSSDGQTMGNYSGSLERDGNVLDFFIKKDLEVTCVFNGKTIPDEDCDKTKFLGVIYCMLFI